MSNLGIAGFERFHQKGEFKTPTREDLKDYFIEIFYHKPTDEQLELFHNYLIGKERDVEKVLDACVLSSQKTEEVEIQKS